MAKNNIPLLLTVPEAAALLKIPKHKVYMLISLDLIDAVRIGNSWRIKSSSIPMEE